MSNPAPGFRKRPDHTIRLHSLAGTLGVRLNGETLAESADVLVLEETGYEPVAYFPRESVRLDRLDASERTTHCPFKGDARYWNDPVIGEPVAWSYERPFDEVADIRERVAFYRDRTDGWTLDGRPVERLPV